MGENKCHWIMIFTDGTKMEKFICVSFTSDELGLAGRAGLGQTGLVAMACE